MNTLVLDTHKAVNTLVSTGHSQTEAEGIVEVLQGAGLKDDPATRIDLAILKTDLVKIIATLIFAGASIVLAGVAVLLQIYGA